MLSTPANGSPPPTTTIFPSGRPPDTSPPGGATATTQNSQEMSAETNSNAMMVDTTPSNQPDIRPPLTNNQQPFSYAKAVAGLPIVPVQQTGSTLWTPVGEHDLIPGERNGELALNISSNFKNRICDPWKRTLVVRLLGLKVGFNTLCNRLRALWRPVGHMEVLDLDRDCFLVKLGNEQDYFKALTDGPWMIFDHYLVVQQWTPAFKVSDPLPKTMIVWVQLPALKIHFYHKEVLTFLGNLIGRTIKLDYHTLNLQRAKFARIAVEVDLSKHLVPRIWLDDAWQKVEYENLPTVCFECGKIGHTSASCPSLRTAVTVLPATQPPSGEPLASPTDVLSEPNSGFGPWMVVSRKSRRNNKESLKKGKNGMDHSNQNHSSQGLMGKESIPRKEDADNPIEPQQPKNEHHAFN
ncbi:unnamed protein product [Linum tenue]|uniref:CCHC-type domain-containing protein n=1 Tax=Linum tenue TaxID=586396 RepID=A0AAV0J7H5_9ROSI|nr:unnamed protein product [Linum tenue]